MFKDELDLFWTCDYSSFNVKILVSSPSVMVGFLTHIFFHKFLMQYFWKQVLPSCFCLGGSIKSSWLGSVKDKTHLLCLPTLSLVFPKHLHCHMKHMKELEMIAKLWNEQCLQQISWGCSFVTWLKKKPKIRKVSGGVTSWSWPYPRGHSHLSGSQAVLFAESQDTRQLPWGLRQISSSRNQRKSCWL